MNPTLTPQNWPDFLAARTRRHFLSRCAVGLGGIALASMLNQARGAGAAPAGPLAPKPTHFPARAKNIIYLFMAGGPSQLELFDYKPKLAELNGQPIPQSFIEGKRFAFMDSSHGRWARGASSRNTAVAGCGFPSCSRTRRGSSTT
jgi:hypothetical protein